MLSWLIDLITYFKYDVLTSLTGSYIINNKQTFWIEFLVYPPECPFTNYDLLTYDGKAVDVAFLRSLYKEFFSPQ